MIIICLHTVIWFQVFPSNTNNFQTDLFDPEQSGPGSNVNERVLSTRCSLMSYPGHFLVEKQVLHLNWGYSQPILSSANKMV